MKNVLHLPIAILALVVATSCNKSDPSVATKIADLESQVRTAIERQQALEGQLAEQQLAAERDAIERERQRIEDERFALEQDQSAEAAAKRAALEERERALASREGKLDGLEFAVEVRQRDLDHRDNLTSGRELDLAGREPLAVEDERPAQVVPVADYGMFYDSLAAYGSWFQTPNYGYVWQPAVYRSFGWRPYYDGRWVCTDGGWTWLSNEPFGWACYHYGRWALLHGRGWVWAPGDQWAPAWVCWRENGSHVGWAPLPPETLAYRDCQWDNTVETRFGIRDSWFNFVAADHFSDPIRRHCLPLWENSACYRNTLNITHISARNGRVFVGGPDYQDLSRTRGRALPYYRLNLDRDQRPGRDLMAMRPRVDAGQLRLAAPEVGTGWNASLRPTRVREQLNAVAIDRPTPLDAEITNQFRRHREQEQAQAEQEVARLGGGVAFNRGRTRELEANRRQATVLAKDAAPRETPAVPNRPDRQPGNVAVQPANLQADARQRNAMTANPQREPLAAVHESQAADRRSQQAEATNPQRAPLATQRPQPLETGREDQTAALRSQQETRQRLANESRVRQQEARAQQAASARQQEEVRQRQANEVRIRQQTAARTQQAASARQQVPTRRQLAIPATPSRVGSSRTMSTGGSRAMPSRVSPSRTMPTGGSPAMPSRVSPRRTMPTGGSPAMPSRVSPRPSTGSSPAMPSRVTPRPVMPPAGGSRATPSRGNSHAP